MQRPSEARLFWEARCIVRYSAVRKKEYKGFEVGRELHLSPAAGGLGIRREEGFMRDKLWIKGRDISEIENRKECPLPLHL